MLVPIVSLKKKLQSLSSKTTPHLKNLDELSATLIQYRSRRFEGRFWKKRSSVTVLLKDDPEWETCVLLMKRATRRGDPWSGHMSFPGGRVDPEDAMPFDAAIRETEEEIGMNLKTHATYLGRLSDVFTRAHQWPGMMIVTPFVFQMTHSVSFQLNHEVAETLWVPLSFLANSKNRKKMYWKMGYVQWKLPCYFYQDRRIWGLTLIMLDELVALFSGKLKTRKPLHLFNQ
ncbi:CoA pyrophosphatase [Deltaproteobacteria bacterium TL4]